ncbi:GNAT family N-acetyltransferase [Zhongshania guokunii]|uniref:GNAT family N-acetyltransferase n=1 Tax=Zhongshania guokunii TaxID=641783 RepID=A0ABV3U5Q0_9GAMM
MKIEIANYQNPQDRAGIVKLMAAYALDPMGGGEALPDAVLANLCDALAGEMGAISLLAFDGDSAVALLTALRGFSTFKCQPLLNIHDVMVLPEYRGQGLSAQMITQLEAYARRHAYCKMTLEVLANNIGAQRVYERCGFAPYQLDPEQGAASFWQKALI